MARKRRIKRTKKYCISVGKGGRLRLTKMKK